MSVEHMAVVLHHSRSSGTAKLVLLGIANHAGDGGAWPKLTTLALYAHRDIRTVRRCLETLVALGELSVDYQAGGSMDLPDHLRPNRYDITLTCPPACDRSPRHRVTDPDDEPTIWVPASAADVAAVRAVDAIDAVDNLLINPRTPVSGGDASVPPPPDASVPPEPSLRTLTNPGPASPTDRRRHIADTALSDHRPCDECGLPEWTCHRAQAAYPLEDRHTYRPHVRPPPRGVT